MADDAEASMSDAEVNVVEKQEPEPEPSSTVDDEMKDSDNKDSEDAADDSEEKKEGAEKEEEEEEDEETKKKRLAELKEKYKDWPLRGIKEPHENDVMYGRGGGTNHHPGNKRYRKLVDDRKLEYVNCKRLDKPLVALEIIRLWRAQLPPGRFLKLDEKTGLWNDVGDKKAREKTSQALREKAPLIRKQQQDEDEDGDEDDKEGETKTTRFAEGTKKEDAAVKKAILARDHSLGREYIEAGQAVSLDGFSWQDPFQQTKAGRDASYGAPAVPPSSYPAGRNSSHGSLGMAPPHHVSIGGPPPPPDYWGRVGSSDNRQREFSNGRYESWGSYGYPPPPPPPPGQAMQHQRSGSWTYGPPPPPGRYVHQRSGSWGSGREHSLGMFPLIGASVGGPADRETFDSGRSGGFWAETAPPPPPPLPHAAGYAAPMRSSGSLGQYRQPASPSGSTPSPNSYNVDLSIAKTWSGGEIQRTWSGEQEPPILQVRSYDGYPRPVAGADSSPTRGGGGGGYMPRPQIVKRDTSNQNENYETKPQVKRAALNRDNSLASNRLKQEYMPEFYNRKFDAEQEMQSLSSNLEQSTLDTERPRPKPLGDSERVTTMDAIAMDLMVRPSLLLKDDRVSTIDALDLDLDDDPLIKAEEAPIALQDLPRPHTLGDADRLTTSDFLDLVNSPIAQVDDGTPETDSDDPLPLNQEKIADEWLTQV